MRSGFCKLELPLKDESEVQKLSSESRLQNLKIVIRNSINFHKFYDWNPTERPVKKIIYFCFDQKLFQYLFPLKHGIKI